MSDADAAAPAAGLDLLIRSSVGPAANKLAALEPTLRRINNHFARYLRAALLQHLRRAVSVTLADIALLPRQELIDGLAAPTHLTMFNMKPLRGTLMMMVDAPLVVTVVETRFGGNGRFPIDTAGREFTAFELKAMRRIVAMMLEQLAVAWEVNGRFEIETLRHETNPQFAGFAAPDALIVASRFDVTVEHGRGTMAVYIPYAGLEPMQEQLNSGIVAEPGNHDRQWSETLAANVEQATITLSAELGTIEVSVGDLVALRPGNVFELRRPETVVVEAGGVPLFRGRWGRHGRKIGVLVEERLMPDATHSAAVMEGTDG